MRSTQFIGLTKKAKDLVVSIERLPSVNFAYGMFDEKIALGSWKDEDTLYDEVVQASPWSSGPMIFTCLLCRGKRLFKWVEDETVTGEVDYENGRYWV